MPDPLRFQVLTPEKTLLDVAAVHSVRLLLADDAWLSVYPGHAPLLAETVAGPVSYVTPSGADEIALAEGILCIDGGVVTIFTGGLVDAPSTVHAVSSDKEDEVVEFDRLAQVLLMTLNAHSEGVLGNDSEVA